MVEEVGMGADEDVVVEFRRVKHSGGGSWKDAFGYVSCWLVAGTGEIPDPPATPPCDWEKWVPGSVIWNDCQIGNYADRTFRELADLR
jgi:hypothetical protein